MTTRLHLANGEHFDVDEQTEAVGITHVNDQAVTGTEYIGPTPPKPKKGVDPAVRRAELQAELDALDEITPMQPDPAPPDPATQARIAELEAELAAAKGGA